MTDCVHVAGVIRLDGAVAPFTKTDVERSFGPVPPDPASRLGHNWRRYLADESLQESDEWLAYVEDRDRVATTPDADKTPTDTDGHPLRITVIDGEPHAWQNITVVIEGDLTGRGDSYLDVIKSWFIASCRRLVRRLSRTKQPPIRYKSHGTEMLGTMRFSCRSAPKSDLPSIHLRPSKTGTRTRVPESLASAFERPLSGLIREIAKTERKPTPKRRLMPMLPFAIAATVPQKAVLDAKIAAARERMDVLRVTNSIRTPSAPVIIAEATAAIARFGVQEMARHLTAMREGRRTETRGDKR